MTDREYRNGFFFFLGLWAAFLINQLSTFVGSF